MSIQQGGKPPSTSFRLLERLRDMGDQQAWDECYELYGPVILAFATQRGCGKALADDVVQETFVRLMRRMPEFNYDPTQGRFHSYVYRIAHGEVVNAFRKEGRYVSPEREPEAGSPTTFFSRLADPNPVGAEQGIWDEEWKQTVLLAALRRVQGRVSRQAYESFQMNVVEGRDIDYICAELGLNRNAVYQHKNRLMKMVAAEVQNICWQCGETSWIA